MITLMVQATLEDAGFEVQSAMDAAEAAMKIANLDNRLSALITDIRLGEGPTGWAVAKGAPTKMPLLPVIYMTGDSAADWTASGVVIDGHSRSATDTICGGFPYWAAVFLLWTWGGSSAIRQR